MLRRASLFALASLLTFSLAQAAEQAKPGSTSSGSATKASGTAADANKRRGQVPPYYGKVVNDQQRQQIYAIQAGYAAKIEKLEAELKQLADARDAAIDALLTPQQREQVAKARTESLAASKAKRDQAAKTAATPPAENK